MEINKLHHTSIAPQTLSDAELVSCPICGRFPPPDDYPYGEFIVWTCCNRTWKASGITLVWVHEVI